MKKPELESAIKKATPVVFEQDRLNLRLTPELTQRLNRYFVKVTNEKGKLPSGIKSAIAYKALTNWLDKHENDLKAWEK